MNSISWQALGEFAPEKPSKTKILLKLVDGQLRPVDKDKIALSDRFLRFLANFGCGPFYLTDIIKKLSDLNTTGENKELLERAIKVLTPKVKHYNERFLRVHIPIDMLQKLHIAPEAKPDDDLLLQVLSATKSTELDEIERKANQYKGSKDTAINQLFGDIQAALVIKRLELDPKQPSDMALFHTLRNVAIEEPLHRNASLSAFTKSFPFTDSTPYMLKEALAIATQKALAPTGNTNKALVDEIFATLDKDLATGEKELDALSQKVLQAPAGDDVYDALYYARGVIVEKKEALAPYTYPPFNKEAKGIIPVRGDGACLFRSFAMGLAYNDISLANPVNPEPDNLGPDRFHQHLRNQVAAYIQDNRDDYVAAQIVGGIEDYNQKLNSDFEAALSQIPKLHDNVTEKILMRITKDHEAKVLTAENYIERLREPTFWGGELELVFLAKLYNVNLKVYHQVDRRIEEKPGTGYSEPGEDRKTISLFYEGQNHYNAYRP